VDFEELKEIQQNEIEALKAIFMDDYHEVVNKSAWKVAHADPEFILHLFPLGVEKNEAHVTVDLKVRFPKTYPNKPPELHLINPRGLTASVLHQLTNSLTKAAQQLVGQEMMYDLSDHIRAFLANHNAPPSATSKLTLHEQMVIRNEQDLKVERERELEELARKREEREAELRVQSDMMNEKIQQDIERKREHARVARQHRQELGFTDEDEAIADDDYFNAHYDSSDSHQILDHLENSDIKTIRFENLITVPIEKQDNGTLSKRICFHTVAIGPCVGKGIIGETFSAQPINYKLLSDKNNNISNKQASDDVDNLVLPSLLAIKRGGSLYDLLMKCGGGLRLAIVRKYMKQLLWALNHIHLNGFICKDLNKSNFLIENEDGNENMRGESPSAWCSPELRERPGVYGRKNDIWCLGVVFIEMLWGVDVTKEFGDFDAFMRTAASELPTIANNFARRLMEPDPKKRPTAIDLMNDPFFAGDNEAMIFEQVAPPVFSSNVAPHMNSGKPIADRNNNHALLPPPLLPTSSQIFEASVAPESKYHSDKTRPVGHQLHRVSSSETSNAATVISTSRYKADFEEIEFLGKGGFGEVIKARNRLDGRLYAIKKIRLDPRDSEDLRKILREVHSLSSLHHQYVVRYFATWFEDEDGSSFKDDSDDESFLDESESDYDEEEDGHVSAYKRQFHDFLSVDKSKSRSYSAIRFDDDDDEDDDDDDEDDEDEDDMTSDDESTPFEKEDNDDSSNFISFAPDDSTSDATTDTASTKKQGLVKKVFHNIKKKSIDEKSSHHHQQHHRTRVLYIQMEYCEKKTLRDVIDEGIDEQEAWRLFRQVLEGLVHIHSQGMIHRDLKPANIFLDSNNDVKIGDFGLATTNQTLVDGTTISRSVSHRFNERYNVSAAESASASYAGYSASSAHIGADESMTTGVGTTFYVSPEVMPDPKTGATSGMRYNQKVDMYSLGIIFFEMCYKFATGMQRVVVLNELRNGKFPDDFPSSYVNQKQIIKLLLSPQPKDRPNSFELLRSDLLPPKLEDEYIKECVRTIANPNTPYYDKLMSAMFSQSADRHKDFTFDYQTTVEVPFDPFSHIFFDCIREQMTKVFRRHGAIDVSAPLLVPKNDLYQWNWKTPVYLMDSQGNLNQLPYDQTVPFARFIARQKGFPELKRFTFDKVYRENPSGGQPEAVLEADFDIVHKETAPMVPDAEVLKVVEEVLEELPPYKRNGGFYFMVNHTGVTDIILDACRVPPDIRKGVLVALSSLGRAPSFATVRNVLKLKYHLQRSVLDELSMFNVHGELESTVKKIEGLLPGSHKSKFRDYVGSLRTLMSVSKHIGIHHKIVFHPLLVYNNHFYKNGMVFETVADTLDSKRKDVLAVGGRYDFLVQHFAHPNATANRKLRAVGVNIAIQKLIRHLDMHQSEQVKYLMKAKNEKMRSFGLWAPKKCDVYVASFGKVLIQERLEIVQELWKHGIRAEFQYNDGDYLTPEDLVSL
ncbi:MAG: kinase-like domain-containing protein, partial [Benjaminiella poitrasii]